MNHWMPTALCMVPLLSGLVLLAFSKEWQGRATVLAVVSATLTMGLSWVLFSMPEATLAQPWLEVGQRFVELGWRVDALSQLVLLMVTAVAWCVVLYSVGYMREDERFTRFLGWILFFVGTMCGMVLSHNLLQLFIFWELMGVASYFLIGFWFTRPSASKAAQKAFLVTRLGDVALLLGLVWIYVQTGTWTFFDGGKGFLESSALAQLSQVSVWESLSVATCIGFLLLIGAMGKSGQFPLHIWLPDAMEGPTPVSALIHAATMVAAGVFLLARCFNLIELPALDGVPWVMGATMGVGTFTMLYAGVVACAQTDIKRVLAYSTISQLGLMMLALGVGSASAGVFHLVTHGFFKALLFLSAGAVIIASHHEQDIRRMGGMRGMIPLVFVLFVTGSLALCGAPLFFSGFWSKEAVLGAVEKAQGHGALFYLVLIGTLLTTFYMTRLVAYVFLGSPRGDVDTESDHAPSLPLWMKLPMLVLGGLALVAGWLGTPAYPWVQKFLTHASLTLNWNALAEVHFWQLTAWSSGAVALGILLGWKLYIHWPILEADEEDPVSVPVPTVYQWMHQGFGVDAGLQRMGRATLMKMGRAVDVVDRWLFQGIITLAEWSAKTCGRVTQSMDVETLNEGLWRSASATQHISSLMQKVQNGRLLHYARLLGLAVILLILLVWVVLK